MTGGVKVSPVVVMSFLTVLAIACCVFLWQRNSNIKSELDRVTGERDSSAAVVANVQRTMNIFSQISAERAREKEQDRQQGEKDRAALRADLQGDSCAVQPLPAAAERRLLDKAGRVRAGAVPEVASGAVPANASP